jgi:DNA-binding CsgD family transcriptional regulator
MNYGIVVDNANLVLDMYSREKLSAYAISKRLGCRKISVLNFLRGRGIDTSRGRKLDPNKPTLKSRKDEVIALKQSGLGCNEIGRQLGYSGSQVYTLLNKAGIETPHSKYELDETFFDEINTEEKAWALGLMYADGNVTKYGKVRIQLQVEDKETLDRVKGLWNYTGELIPIPPPKKYPHRKHQLLLNVDRQRFAKALIAAGCMPAKSMKLKFPIDGPVPGHLLCHFVRGYCDGDGSVQVKKKKYLSFSFVGTFDFITVLQNLLVSLGIESRSYPRYKESGELSSYQLFISRQESAIRLRSWLYPSGNKCGMLRKRLKAFSV